MGDKGTGPALNAVGTGLVHRFAAVDVMADFRFVQRGKAHFTDRQGRLQAFVEDDTNCCQHTMRLPGKALQDASGIGGIYRLADDFAVEFERGIGGQHRLAKQLAPADDLPAMPGLGLSDPLHVVDRCFAKQRILAGFRVFSRRQAKTQGVESDANLVQEFAPTRAARGKVEAWEPGVLSG